MRTRDQIQTVLDALEYIKLHVPFSDEDGTMYSESAIAILTAALAEPSEPKPYCCYCESANEGIRSTYFDQTCEGCVKRMTHPAKPSPLTNGEIFNLADPFGAFQYGDAQGDKRLAFARAIEAAVWAKFAAVKQDAAIKEKFE